MANDWFVRNVMEATIRYGEGQPLPVAARTFTAEEIAARNKSQATLIRLLLFPVIAIAALLILLDWRRGGDALLTYGSLVALAGIGLFLYTRVHAARQQDYHDPRIEVTADEEGIELRRPDEAHRIGYDTAIVRVIGISHDGGPAFDGIRIDTPFGQIDLHERTYHNGAEAAGAIAVRVAALGRPLPVSRGWRS